VFARRLRTHQTSARAATEACLEAIAARDRELNAFTLVMAEDARRQADALDAEMRAGVDRGPMHGVPVSIKDLIDVAGTPTSAASQVREGHVARTDAAAVATLRRAGAVIVGKTNLHEFAFGTTNEDSAFGPARNPRDPSRSPGGSSGGSAVSVAAGMALASVGTDTGGSIRIPSAACGLVGLKPRYGEIATDGVTPLSSRLDHVGPIALTASDVRALYNGLKGTTPDAPSPVSLRGLTLGCLRRYFAERLEDQVRKAFDGALGRLRDAGVHVIDVGIDDAGRIGETYVSIVLVEALRYHERTLATMADRYTPAVRERLEAARGIDDEEFARALEERERLRAQVDAALGTCDALILPTLPIVAPRLGTDKVDLGGGPEPLRTAMLRNTQLFNLTGHPAVAIPADQLRDGLPASVQLVAASTARLLDIADGCEAQIRGGPVPGSGVGG
jgi:aspartyl-tRNA(Asn)/glutamyl-tRNA(Gln) amidotransferase subunit A